jgi:hypothetical protein
MQHVAESGLALSTRETQDEAMVSLLRFAVGGLVLFGEAWADAASDEKPDIQVILVVLAEGPDREARQPRVAVDAQGRIYVTFGVGNASRCARSDDGGRPFEVAKVGTVDALSLGMRRGPRVAVAGETLVVSAIGGRERKGKDGDLLGLVGTFQGNRR